MTNRIYEPTRNVLESITNSDTNSSTTDPISAIEYSVNEIGQRESVARSGSGTATPASASATYTYNERGELITANETTDALDRAYQFDGIGNREKTVAGSLTLPGTKNYTVNALNQYTVIPNLSATPAYDDDGNATAYPLPVNPAANATLTYDGENRLIKVVTASTTIEYTYDSLSRRIIKTVGTQRTYYVYDGWNCISEFTGTKHTSGSAPTLTRTQSYTWGLDLSQSLQGAGGVGGLLAVTHIPVSSAPETYYPLYDGNGNITAYIDEACNVEASFDYDPFGNITNNNNTLNFTYAFSTKPKESDTGLYYYGYRWYDPLTGRWPSRDPIEEEGGANLYGFVGNDSMGLFDYLGLAADDDLWGQIAEKLEDLATSMFFASKDPSGSMIAGVDEVINQTFSPITHGEVEIKPLKECGCYESQSYAEYGANFMSSYFTALSFALAYEAAFAKTYNYRLSKYNAPKNPFLEENFKFKEKKSPLRNKTVLEEAIENAYRVDDQLVYDTPEGVRIVFRKEKHPIDPCGPSVLHWNIEVMTIRRDRFGNLRPGRYKQQIDTHILLDEGGNVTEIKHTGPKAPSNL